MEKYRSEEIMNLSCKGYFKSMGYSEDELGHKPRIGIANSWNQLVPGHYNLRQVAEYVKRGIYAAGGVACEFGVMAACDGVAQGHIGMKYILPSREIVCNSVEIMVQAHQLDAVVLLASCDKIVPGMLMAAARLNVPAILVNGGPMLGGIFFDGRKSDGTSPDEAKGMLAAGKITQDELDNLIDACGPGCGSCSFFGTANTMCCVAEALGMSLTGCAVIPAVYAERLRCAYNSGMKIVELCKKDIKPRDIITEASVRNAIKCVMAVCGSTNAALHISAIALEAGLKDMNVMDAFDEISKTTPELAKINPASHWSLEDFYFAGGMPRVMQKLGDILDTSVMTVNGCTLGESLSKYKFIYPENKDLIRDRSNPYSETGGLAILRGNLAPKTAITKPGAYAPELRRFTGKAKVFDCEEDAETAILNGEIKPGNVVVIRYEGPKGGPGMREMYKAMKYLYGMGLNLSTALITDGRFSGTNNGCFVGHISPEAAEGGPIAIVEDGDEIYIDAIDGKLELKVSDEEIKRRLANWKKPEKEIPEGYLRLYAKVAASADKGAIIDL
ncbi:MAG: dihydroxy-acid dehydratase [Clostridia bacterium]|jgi:dihydroxy-acid dehydratase|nr:dihydroxy-acid dehydratase [Clostridia bacterium]MCI1958283.1 dihydroxy-acid dehydratase [Clostridia bacterium]MCI2000033.1 dihydroxy-acid dehydratase [Clostridia bacterium]MCI2014433.1 dihydroxy-acid dehydratase [Clostridia bacterium]